jgi:hypothetical protein
MGREDYLYHEIKEEEVRGRWVGFWGGGYGLMNDLTNISCR